jgi:UDP-galactopyranose mutase
MTEQCDLLVVGAGYAGSVIAERAATEAGASVLVIDRRDHIAGNAYDYADEAGVLVHRYGPHLFHTNSEKISDYLSRFTEWHPYEHRALASVGGELYPLPVNRTTVNRLYGLDLETEEECQAYYDSVAEPVDLVKTSEEAVVSKVGRDLYEKFFRGYTRKQWALDPSELHASVTSRIPVRTNTDDRYFTDSFQAIPVDGYTAMFERILDHPLIEVRTGVDYFDIRNEVDARHLVWTGPIDAFFDHRFGQLPYRSLEFELETFDVPDGGLVLPVAMVNEPGEEVPYTRRTEFRHITGQESSKTTVAKEFPTAEGDPYYPIPRDENRELYKRYRALADELADVTFVGRLATYQYLNMDQVVGQALKAFDGMLESGVLNSQSP